MLQEPGSQFNGYWRRWRVQNCGSQQPAAHPLLPSSWHAVTAEKENLPPGLAEFVGRLFEGPAGTHSHRIILGANGADVDPARGGKVEPGSHGFLRADLGPLPLHNAQLNIFPFCFQQTAMPQAGRLAVSWTFNGQNNPSARQQRRELPSLNAAYFGVVGCHHKDGNPGNRAEFGNVVSMAAENDPTDPRASSRACHMRKSRRSGRLKDDHFRAAGGLRLDVLK